MKQSHKYIFYFYPNEEKNLKGFFRYYEKVKDGKECAKRLNRKYDHKKIY